MLNLAAQEDERASSGQDGQMSSATSQGKSWQRSDSAAGGDGLEGKCGANVGAGVDHELAVRRPDGIDRVFLDERGGGATVERHSVKVGNCVIQCGGGE